RLMVLRPGVANSTVPGFSEWEEAGIPSSNVHVYTVSPVPQAATKAVGSITAAPQKSRIGAISTVGGAYTSTVCSVLLKVPQLAVIIRCMLYSPGFVKRKTGSWEFLSDPGANSQSVSVPQLPLA